MLLSLLATKKKKDSSFIIPPNHFTGTPIPAPALKLSPKEKEVIVNNEYAKGDSAAPAESQLPKPTPGGAADCAPITSETAIKEPEVQEASEAKESPEENRISEPEAQRLEPEIQAPSAKQLQEEKPSEEKKSEGNDLADKKVSGLSLKSIQKKKELEAQKREAMVEEEVVKNGKFTEEQMQAAWQEFSEEQNEKGEKILASIMQTDTPALMGKNICIELPNETMKLELERVQYYLMGFLKEKLQNTHIQLKVSVNEKAEKKFAFTAIEKFEKLREKNPLIEKLRSTFDLDV